MQPRKLADLSAAWVLLAHVQLTAHQHPMASSTELLQPGSPQAVPLQGVVSLQVQDFAFALAEFCKGPVGPFLQPVWVPLDGSPAQEHTSWCPQGGVICKLDERSVFQSISYGVEQHWSHGTSLHCVRYI